MGEGLIRIGLRRNIFSENDQLTPFLDHLRWLSAFAVCAGHLRNILFPDFSARLHLNLPEKMFYFFTLFGPQAVIVFFVISGLLIGGKLVLNVAENSYSWWPYLVARLSRLWMVLIPSMILSWLLLSNRLCLPAACDPIGIRDVIGTLFFLQNIWTNTFPNNFPLWSLSNEAAYYFLAPFVILFAFRKKPILTGAVTGLACVCLLATTKIDARAVLPTAPLWFIGILPMFLKIRISAAFPGALFLVAACASRLGVFPNDLTGWFAIAITLSVTLCSDLPRLPRSISQPIDRFGRWAAKFSYSLYLVHMPIEQMFGSYLHRRLQPDAIRAYAVYVGILTFVLFFAYLFAVIFERRTDAVRSWVLRFSVSKKLPISS